MFIGRSKELKQLNYYYGSEGFQFPVIYGRRRVGKTALINEFCKDKEKIYFTAIESNLRQNLVNFTKSIHDYEGKENLGLSFDHFQNALEYIFKCSLEKRMILVIDEYPYLAKVCNEISSILQILIDKYKDESKLFLILCGSSMSFMEEQVLGYQSPLYGRRTAQFKILPFDYFESRLFLPSFNELEKAEIYGITGGTPQYLLKIVNGMSLEDNIKFNLLNPSCYLFEEPNNLLKQEVREANFYNSIIGVIAQGTTKLNEISSKLQEDSSKVMMAINKLMKLGIVKKETPLGNDVKRKSIYLLEDNLFNYWYRFISPNISLLQNDMIDLVYNNIQSYKNEYMGFVFEDICKQYLWELNKKNQLPFVFNSIGKWWGNDPIKKEEVEVDILAIGDHCAILGECKWQNDKVSLKVLQKLVDRYRLFKYEKIVGYVFSKSGFDKDCFEYANEHNIILVEFKDMKI